MRKSYPALLLLLSCLCPLSLISKANAGTLFGPVFNVSVSPKTNESKITDPTTSQTTTYKGMIYKGTLGYNLGLISLLGEYEKKEMENTSDKTEKRDDNNYGATLKIHLGPFFNVGSSYYITNAKITPSSSPAYKLQGHKSTANAGISIPLPRGMSAYANGQYILSSRFDKMDGQKLDKVYKEEGHSFDFGLSFGL